MPVLKSHYDTLTVDELRVKLDEAKRLIDKAERTGQSGAFELWTQEVPILKTAINEKESVV